MYTRKCLLLGVSKLTLQVTVRYTAIHLPLYLFINHETLLSIMRYILLGVYTLVTTSIGEGTSYRMFYQREKGHQKTKTLNQLQKLSIN